MRRFGRILAVCVVVALALQIGVCAFDACGECIESHARSDHHGAGIATNACHNCLCVGTAFATATCILPLESLTFLRVMPSVGVPEPHVGGPFLPPRLSV